MCVHYQIGELVIVVRNNVFVGVAWKQCSISFILENTFHDLDFTSDATFGNENLMIFFNRMHFEEFIEIEKENFAISRS